MFSNLLGLETRKWSSAENWQDKNIVSKTVIKVGQQRSSKANRCYKLEIIIKWKSDKGIATMNHSHGASMGVLIL